MKLSKTAIIEQLRTQYPIGLSKCKEIVENCDLDIELATTKVKEFLAGQLGQSLNISVKEADALLIGSNFNLNKAKQKFYETHKSVSSQIIEKNSSSEDKVWRIFRAIEENQKSGHKSTSLTTKFYDFCQNLHYAELESINSAIYKKLIDSAKRLKSDAISTTLKHNQKQASDEWLSENLQKTKPLLMDNLVQLVQQNLNEFP